MLNLTKKNTEKNQSEINSIKPEDPETVQFHTEPVEEVLEGELDVRNHEAVTTEDFSPNPYDIPLQFFGFEDEESQKNYYDNLVDPFHEFITQNNPTILEMGAGRGDFGKYLNDRYHGVEYIGYTDSMQFKNCNNVFFGNLNEFGTQLPAQNIDLVYHNLILQRSNSWVMFGEVKTPLEIFKYFTTSWNLVYDHSVKYSFFTISINSSHDIELYKDIISFAVDMNMSYSSDYLGESKLINFILSHQ